MQRMALIFAVWIFGVGAALAQSAVTVIGGITPGNCVAFFSTTQIKDAGAICAAGTPFANPTGAVGLTPVNGASTSAMRSDAAPPLSSSVQSALTGTNSALLVGTGAFGFAATAAPTTAGQIAFWNGSSWVFLAAPTTAGSIIYWNGTTYAVLAGNTSGSQTLTENASGVPSWSAAGAGSVTTPGNGLVSSTTANCSQTANQTTLSASECVNAQTGTSYTFVDGDRAKLVTGTNASAQSYSLPQAGASSQFVGGWFVDVQNRGAGNLTITPTTSTIDGASSLLLSPGQGIRIASDGTNYFTKRGMPQLPSLVNSLGADVALNNTGTYFTGPTVSQGTVGTWFASGQATVQDTSGARDIQCKLWDGTTVIDSARVSTNGANFFGIVSLSGVLSAPAGNINISCNCPGATTAKIVFNASGNSKDSTLTVFRIQ